MFKLILVMFGLIIIRIADLIRVNKRIKYLWEQNESLEYFVHSKGLLGEYDTYCSQKETRRLVGLPMEYLFWKVRNEDEGEG